MEKEEMKSHNVWVVDNAMEKTDELIANLKILQNKSKVFRELEEGTLVYVEFSEEQRSTISPHGKIGILKGFGDIYSSYPRKAHIAIRTQKGRYVTKTKEGFQYMGSVSTFDMTIEPEDTIFIGEKIIDKALEKYGLTSDAYMEEVEKAFD